MTKVERNVSKNVQLEVSITQCLNIQIFVCLTLNSYDGIIHLVTAADGAENYYTTMNNIVRKETPQQVIHSHFYSVIDTGN